MGGKMGHLTDEEVIEEQDDRLAAESEGRGLGITLYDLKFGADFGNLRVLHHGFNPQKQQLYSRRVVFTKGNIERRYRSVSEASVKMKFSRHQIESAASRGHVLDGWRVEYSHG